MRLRSWFLGLKLRALRQHESTLTWLTGSTLSLLEFIYVLMLVKYNKPPSDSKLGDGLLLLYSHSHDAPEHCGKHHESLEDSRVATLQRAEFQG